EMRFYRVPWRPLSIGTLLLMGKNIDALHCDLAHILRPVIPLKINTPLVVTFHDWQPLSEKEFSASRPWPLKAGYDAFYHWAYPRTAAKARAIVNVSAATQRETAKYAPQVQARSHVVLSGLDQFFRQLPAEEESDRTAAELGLPHNY